MDAANNRQKLRKAVFSKCENPGSDEYNKIQAKLMNVVDEFVKNEKTGECCGVKAGQLTDYIAQLIYLAPGSAGKILDLLLKKDPLTYYKRIKGVLMNDPMIALYREDESEDEKGEARPQENDKQGEPNVYEVTKEELVIPNVMDLDIIQALAYTDHVQIFAKKSVQAMLYAAWTPIMVPGTRIKTLLALVDLAALFAWGMTTAGGHTFDRLMWTTTHDSTNKTWLREHDLPDNVWIAGDALDHIYAYNSPRHVPSCWHVLASSFLRQFIDMVWMIKAFMEKKGNAGKQDHHLDLFWGWDALFLMLGNTLPILIFFKGIFLWHTMGRKELVMTSTQQGMLCATVVFTSTALLSPFRVVACRISLSLIAIKKAVIQEDVLHFFAFITFIFVFYILAFEILDREKTLAFGLVQGFRALIVGDGDGLDFLGLKTDDKTVVNEEAHRFRAAFGTLGMILFFSYLMQLLIAIFSNTYDDAVKNVWLHFHQARAQDLRDAVLGNHKFRKHSFIMQRMEKLGMLWLFKKPVWISEVTACMEKLSAGWLLHQPYMLSIGVVTFVIGILMQYGVHAMNNNAFHEKLYISTAIVSILLLTLGSVLMESSVFIHEDIEKDWFPAPDDEVQTHKHRLWIFCRADYDERRFLGDDEVEIRVEKVQEQLDKLLDKFGKIEEKLRDKLRDKLTDL